MQDGENEGKTFDLNERQNAVMGAFNELYPRQPVPEPVYVEDNRPWIVAYMDDSIVVCDMGDYYKVPYTMNGGKVELAQRQDWQEVTPTQEWTAISKSIIDAKIGSRNNRGDAHRLQMIHDMSVMNGAMCNSKSIDAPAFEELFETETLVAFGGDVKALGDGKVGGYLVRFTTENDPDLEREFFNAKTDFGVLNISPVLYQHGMDSKLKRRRIGKGELRTDEIGVWIEAQLDMRDDYEKAVYQLAQSGKLGWSSGTASHLVEREHMGKAVWIKAWPLGLDASLTPTPAEPRNQAIPLKSLYASGETIDEAPVTSDDSTPVSEKQTIINNFNYYGTTTLEAGTPLPAKEIKMAENEQGGNVNVTPEIDYDKLATAVASKLDTTLAAKSAPAVINSENLGDPDPYKALTLWAQGKQAKGLKGLGATVDGDHLHFGYTKAALQEDTASEGGALVPNDFYSGIVAKRDEVSIARRAGARIFQTSRDVLDIPVEDTKMANFVATSEEAAYNENEPTFNTVQVRVYKYTKTIKLSEELVEDQDANLDAFLTEAIGRSWGLTENALVLTGSGSSTVQGVFVGGTVGYTFADTDGIAVAEIPALYWTLGSPYHEGAVWITRGATMGNLQGLTGSNFQLVNTPPFNGQNLFWAGKPYFLSDSVDALATGKKVIMIGNFEYYALVQRRGLTITRNPYLYQATGQIGMFASLRFGGAVLQSEAFKWGITA